MNVKLGTKVKDSLTQFTGTAISRTHFLHGCVHICVQSRNLNREGGLVEEWIDESRLVKKYQPPAAPPFPLGGQVKDSITGFEGVATSRLEQLNGSVRIGVTSPTMRNDKNHPLELYFDLQRLGLDQKSAPTPKAGGPGTVSQLRTGPER